MTGKTSHSLTQYDDREHYHCPQLGDTVSFSYCRQMNEGVPCRLLYTCWNEFLDVDAYVKEHFTREEIRTAFHTPSRGRMGTLFDALNRALDQKDKS